MSKLALLSLALIAYAVSVSSLACQRPNCNRTCCGTQVQTWSHSPCGGTPAPAPTTAKLTCLGDGRIQVEITSDRNRLSSIRISVVDQKGDELRGCPKINEVYRISNPPSSPGEFRPPSPTTRPRTTMAGPYPDYPEYSDYWNIPSAVHVPIQEIDYENSKITDLEDKATTITNTWIINSGQYNDCNVTSSQPCQIPNCNNNIPLNEQLQVVGRNLRVRQTFYINGVIEQVVINDLSISCKIFIRQPEQQSLVPCIGCCHKISLCLTAKFRFGCKVSENGLVTTVEEDSFPSQDSQLGWEINRLTYVKDDIISCKAPANPLFNTINGQISPARPPSNQYAVSTDHVVGQPDVCAACMPASASVSFCVRDNSKNNFQHCSTNCPVGKPNLICG